MINKLVVENLKHRRVRTLISVLFIGLEVTMMLTLVGVSRGTLNESKRRARGVGADVWIKPSGAGALSFGTASISDKMIPYFKQLPHVTDVTGSVIHPINMLTPVTGIDIAAYNRMSGGFKFVSGGPFQGPNDILVDEYFARQNKKVVGDSVKMLNQDWRIAGITEPGQLARLILPIQRLQELTATTGKLSQIFVKVDRPENTASVIQDIKSRNLELQVYSLDELLSMFNVDNVPMLKPFTGVVIGISIIVGFLITLLTMYTAVLERTREIGILKAMGASPSYILNILLRETAILAVLGVVAGVVMSFVARWLLFTFAPASLTQEIVPDWWLIAGAIALTGAILGALYPGWKAARQDAIEALAYD